MHYIVFYSPLQEKNQAVCHPEQARASGEGAPKDPEDLSLAMPRQGVLLNAVMRK